MTDTAERTARLALSPAELQTESIAGSAFPYRADALRALPFAHDDIARDFGDDIYLRMLRDPVMAAAHDTLRSGILSQGMRFTPRLSDPDTDGYDLANEVAQFVSDVIEDLETPLDDVLHDMLQALALGNRVAELVWQYAPARRYYALDQSSTVSSSQTLLTLRAIKPKPRYATAFVVDEFMNTAGLLPTLRPDGSTRAGWFGLGGGPLIRVDGPDGTNGASINQADLIPIEKCLIYTYHPENCDPRGTSAYRAVYTPWNLKQQLYPEWFKFLAQFASPSIYAVLGEKAAPIRRAQPDGSVEVVAAERSTLQTLLDFQNGSAAVFPYGTLLDLIQSTGEGSAFLSAFAFCDQQMVLAALHQTLATLEGAHESRAASETHQDTLDLLVQQARRGLCLAVYRDVVTPLVAYNYGVNAASRLAPIPELGMTQMPDIPSLMTAIAQLARAKYLDISQLPGIDTLLQLPQRQIAPETRQTDQETPNAPQPATEPDDETEPTAASTDGLDEPDDQEDQP